MNKLRQILIDHLRDQGMTDDHIASYLKALKELVDSEPGIETDKLNQKLHSLGWNEVSINYHFLQIALACFEEDSGIRPHSSLNHRPPEAA
jgi:hypothetical protein